MKQPNDPNDNAHPEEGYKTWNLEGVTLFRTLGYVVGLPSFIVGTAVFMLGFALRDPDILNVACLLYSLALVSIGGRPMLLRLNPQNEIQALKIAALSIVAGVICYGVLLAVIVQTSPTHSLIQSNRIDEPLSLRGDELKFSSLCLKLRNQ